MYSSPTIPRTASPRPGPPAQNVRDTSMEPNIRPMQVKVLYTFDDQNKTNCLARCPQPIRVETAFLDGSTQIGIVELGTCIQAIINASPELIAKLGQDFTVYAYDYSEYETPLVGQGMLSWMLASISPTPMAPAVQSKTKVTGRVSKNVLGLFADGAKETLEVKLRLVPVPTCLQGEYLQNMEKYRDTSNVVTENFDTEAWTNFLHDNPQFGAPTVEEMEQLIANDQTNFNTDDIMLDSEQPASSDSLAFLAPAEAESSAPIEFVMYGTPDQVANNPRLRTPSQPPQRPDPVRPSSRASNKGRPAVRKSKSMSRVENSRTLETSDAEEGPSRKRAKIMKTDWRGPSAFDSNEESLRVTASTAASIRGHRPMAALAAAENPVRPPTPRPKAGGRSRKMPSLLRSSTSVSHAAMTRHDTGYRSPYVEIDSDAIVTSPEAMSDISTPQDIPSSPPVMRPASPTPSSPQLPMLPNDIDSGFVSGPIDECFDDDDERHLNDEDVDMAARFTHRGSESTSGESALLPKKKAAAAPSRPRKRTGSAVSSPKPDSQPDGSTPMDKSQISASDPSQVERSEPAQSTADKPTERPRTSESAVSECTSRPPSPNRSEAVKPPPGRRGSGVTFNKRQQAIREKLVSSIAAGQVPIHCEHCGEIDTPTWRKAFVSIEAGPPPDTKFQTPKNPDPSDPYGIIAYEVLEKETDGTISSHRVFKKYIQPEENTTFDELRLCNPCGIHLFKYRQMRPTERWGKQTKSKSRKKPPKSADSPSEWDQRQQSELPMPEDVEPVPAAPDANDTKNEVVSADPARSRTNSVSQHDVARSDGSLLDGPAAVAALKKAIQSSPPKFPGSKYSPITVDEEAPSEPTRRLLFPSPRKAGELKSLEGSPNAKAAIGTNKQSADTVLLHNPDRSLQRESDRSHPAVANGNKDENKLLQPGNFAGSQTPSKDRHTNPLQTPTSRTSGATRTPTGALSSATRRWHRAFDSTPSLSRGGYSSSDGVLPPEMTPFTAQLTQLLSEANNLTPSKAMRNADLFGDGISSGSDDQGNLFAFSDFSAEDVGLPSMVLETSPCLPPLKEGLLAMDALEMEL